MRQLVLHKGATPCSRTYLAGVPTPGPRGDWHPVPHSALVDLVHEHIASGGSRVVRENYGVWRDGLRFFGTLELESSSPDYGVVVGLRNSHDQAFSAGLVLGSKVFVCDNLAFSGEVRIARKHTRHIMRDLPRLAAEAVGKLVDMRTTQDARIASYKARELNEIVVHDAVVRAVDAKIVANARVPDVLDQWRRPRLAEFQPRTAWSLFNAFTEVLKDVGQSDDFPRRTIALHGLFDRLSAT